MTARTTCVPAARAARRFLFRAALIALAIWAAFWHAASTAAAAFVGSRSTTTGAIISDNGWSSKNGGFRIDFTVTEVGPLWQYDYVFKDADGSGLDPNITRFLKLEVSQNVPAAQHWLISDGTGPTNPGDLLLLAPALVTFHLWDAPASDPSYPLYSIFVGDDNDGVADQLSDDRVSILSTQGPMWGSFYVRDGHTESSAPAEAVNRGFNNGVFPNPSGGTFSSVGGRPAFDPLQDPNATALKHWILVPDTFTTTEIPEPASVVLAGFGITALGGVALARRRKRRR
jgi:hypothetical protein